MNQIAVIIPSYNAEKYISRCLNSIQQQSHTSWEVYIIDDCSTDQSYALCEKWCREDSRFHLYRNHENSGPGKTRNVGLDLIAARADIDFILFIDSDDYIHPNYMETLLRLQKDNQADIVWINPKDVNEEEKITFATIPKDIPVRMQTGKDVILCEKNRVMFSVLWGKLFRASLWKTNRMEERLRWGEDASTTFRILYEAKRVLKAEIAIYYYCFSTDSAVRSKETEAKCQATIDKNYIKMDFYKKHKERVLYERVFASYLIDLIHVEIRCIGHKELKEYSKKVRKLYKKEWKQVLSHRDTSKKRKLIFSIYRFIPGIKYVYKYIRP